MIGGFSTIAESEFDVISVEDSEGVPSVGFDGAIHPLKTTLTNPRRKYIFIGESSLCRCISSTL
jgi:hypothetical protein